MASAPPGFPYFPLYVKDWLTGQSTALMLPEAKGAFVDLLAHAWLADPPCTLPDDDRSLSKLSGLGAKWRRIGPSLREQFELVEGRLRNAKQWAVWQDMMTHRERRKGAGRKGNEARWGSQCESQSDRIGSRIDVAKPSPALAFALASSTTTTRQSASPKYDQIFEEAWGSYPKRPNNSKSAAWRQWLARVGEGVDPLDMLEGTRRYAKFVEAEQTLPKYVKLAATFYGRDRHFENDLTPTPAADPLASRVAQIMAEDEAAEARTLQLLASRRPA